MIRLAFWGGLSWCGWTYAVHHPAQVLQFLDRLLELCWVLAPLFLLMVVYKKVKGHPVVW